MNLLKNISLWGKNNPIKARIIIVLSHLILLLSSIYLGVISYVYDFDLPYEIIPILVSLFFLAYWFYPKKGQRNGWQRHSYTRQKTMDGVLIVSSFVILVLGVNRFAVEPIPLSSAKAHFIVNTSPKQQSEKLNLRKTFKSIKKKLKNDLKELKNSVKRNGTDNPKAHQILLVCLTLLLTTGLIFLSIGLSCNISCSGQGSVATIVLVGGIIASIGIAVLLINLILKKNKTV